MKEGKITTYLLNKFSIVFALCFFFVLLYIFGSKQLKISNVKKTLNPVVYFEIPVSNMERASERLYGVTDVNGVKT